MQRKSKSTVHGCLRVTHLTAPPPPPGHRGAGPARPRAGAAHTPDGGTADPAAAGDGGGPALAGEGGEVSGN